MISITAVHELLAYDCRQLEREVSAVESLLLLLDDVDDIVALIVHAASPAVVAVIVACLAIVAVSVLAAGLYGLLIAPLACGLLIACLPATRASPHP